MLDSDDVIKSDVDADTNTNSDVSEHPKTKPPRKARLGTEPMRSPAVRRKRYRTKRTSGSSR